MALTVEVINDDFSDRLLNGAHGVFPRFKLANDVEVTPLAATLRYYISMLALQNNAMPLSFFNLRTTFFVSPRLACSQGNNSARAVIELLHLRLSAHCSDDSDRINAALCHCYGRPLKTDMMPSEPSYTHYSNIEQMTDELKTPLSNLKRLISHLAQ
ncbi:hypothetical protein QO021_28995 (plasmid) [Pseudomonas amygdali pv. lachrymans]|nr:hypothetical protein [Pseudomonas amygdali]WIO61597.1 hypothetical protein QO021_28995 [Pseudomonas amygdali pv. lachrymans]